MELELTEKERQMLIELLVQKINKIHVSISESAAKSVATILDEYVVEHGKFNQLLGKLKAL